MTEKEDSYRKCTCKESRDHCFLARLHALLMQSQRARCKKRWTTFCSGKTSMVVSDRLATVRNAHVGSQELSPRNIREE